jgi:hypothetical protein
MQMSPSSEAASCAATQEFLNILWNPKVYFRVQKSLPLVPILSQINPVYTTPSYFSTMYILIMWHRPTARQRLGKHIPAGANPRKNRTSIATERISKQA